MNKVLSQAIKKAVSEFSPNIDSSEVQKRPDLFSLNKETELFQNSKGIKSVILMGSNEIRKKVFELKDMDSGKQTTYSLSKLINLF